MIWRMHPPAAWQSFGNRLLTAFFLHTIAKARDSVCNAYLSITIKGLSTKAMAEERQA